MRFFDGKPELNGLPATFGTEQECNTLRIICEDKYAGMQVELLFSVFHDTDVITRSVKITNIGQKHFYLTKVYSACIDMDNNDFDMISLHGSWARERYIQRKTLGYGIQNVSSFRGQSGHQDHPFLALVDKNTTQEHGEIYAMNFVYSGNFWCTGRSITVWFCADVHWEFIQKISVGNWNQAKASRLLKW